jgi:chemotaxis protein MotB
MRTRFPLLAVVLVASAAAACGPSQQEITRRDERIRELEEENEARANDNAAMVAQLASIEEQNQRMAAVVEGLARHIESSELGQATLEENLSEAEGALSELEVDRQTLTADLDAARRALAAAAGREQRARDRAALFQAMLRRFASLIEAGHVRVHVVRNRMVVELPEAVLFDTGRAVIKPNGQTVLAQVATGLAEIEQRDFQVAGHTDNVPIHTSRFPSNWELSTGRALVVAAFLRDRGVPAARLSVAGFADTQPVADNDTDAGRAQNRRIEIVLLPNFDELPNLGSLPGG